MKYKEKHKEHLKRFLGVTTLAVSMLMPTGCSNNSNQTSKDEQQCGLLDSRPMKVHDKYGTPMVLYHVNVPIFNKNGERKKEKGTAKTAVPFLCARSVFCAHTKTTFQNPCWNSQFRYAFLCT
jgi:hypothetical protein